MDILHIRNRGLRHPLWLAALLLAVAAAAQGPPPNWAVDPAEYQFSMTVVGRLKVNGVADHAAGNIVAAFVGNQLRGVARPVGAAGDTYYFLTVHANAYAGEAIELKAYHAATGLVLGAVETLTFGHNQAIGKPGAPFSVNACTPGAAEDCNRIGLPGIDDDCDGQVDEDLTAPVARCKDTGVALGPLGTATLAGSAINDGSSDACTAAADLLLAATPAAFTCDDAGTRSATLTVTDAAGRTATCTATVTVLDVLNHAQEAQRTAPDGLAGDNLGWGLGLDGAVLVAGAPNDKVGTQNKQGSAHVFLQGLGGAGNWGQLKQIKASDGAAVDYFGNAVSVDGPLALVGAHGDNVGAVTDAGSAYVFEKDLGGTDNWGQRANIQARAGAAAEPAAYDYFANAVSLKSGRAVVGAAKKAVSGNAARGAAYIYEKDAGGANAWGHVKKLVAPDGAANNFFGQSVAQSGDLVLVGANGNLSNRGAAYLFGRDHGGPGNWGMAQKLAAPDAAVGDGFGTSVSLTAAYALVGAPNKAAYAGAAYVFQHAAGTWAHLKKLTASDAAADDRFGASVALSGDYAYVAALRGNGGAGALYVFHKDAGGAGNWGQIGRYTAAGGAQGDQFGQSLAVSGPVAALGASLDDVGAKTDQGSALLLRGRDCASGPKPGGETAAQESPAPAAAPARCWPSPFRDELTVEVGDRETGNWEVQLVDALGRVVVRAGTPAGQRRATLRTDRLPQGHYTIRVRTKNAAASIPATLVR